MASQLECDPIRSTGSFSTMMGPSESSLGFDSIWGAGSSGTGMSPMGSRGGGGSINLYGADAQAMCMFMQLTRPSCVHVLEDNSLFFGYYGGIDNSKADAAYSLTLGHRSGFKGYAVNNGTGPLASLGGSCTSPSVDEFILLGANLPDFSKLDMPHKVMFLLLAGAASDTKFVNIHTVFKNFAPVAGDGTYGFFTKQPVKVKLGGHWYTITMSLFINTKTSTNGYNPVFNLSLNNPLPTPTPYGNGTGFNYHHDACFYVWIGGPSEEGKAFQSWYDRMK